MFFIPYFCGKIDVELQISRFLNRSVSYRKSRVRANGACYRHIFQTLARKLKATLAFYFGSGLIQTQNAMMAARTTADKKIASLS
jgi:hypothetical protein